MGLEKRGDNLYYYRKVRVGNRVKSVYTGSGLYAMRLAFDKLSARGAPKAENTLKIRLQDPEERLFSSLDSYYSAVEGRYSNAMHAAGYHKPNRGPWRKRRGREESQ